ncbi:transcriptional regulator [Phyllobacterium phragmitis]|uniref:Transcriptional regulator n=1 Tax=Phyllobacterium phragmitis TaxID=2670329 RepID=A0A2S9IVY4_9HYPH|nr:substrate-binding domain-containing protein [Phyllobacterium phragmitis]PRD44678.1 transcriptional regulator [Phyllobacterium phragmitis]
MNLKELARLLNLSQTTVSRALNGYPEVNEATRQRVLQAVKATGYRPNKAAQRLATGKAGSIGLVMPTGTGDGTDLHFAEFLSGLGEIAETNDVQLVIDPSRVGNEAMAFQRLAASGTVDALCLSYVRASDPRIDTLKSLRLPFLVHGRHVGSAPDYPFMDIDNCGAFRDAARLLLQLGHRRIALLNGLADLSFAARRHEGMGEALAEYGIALEEGFCQHTGMTEENGYRGTMRFLDMDEAPTAILCSSIVLALGATRAINQRGLKIGRDISLIAHDDVFPYLKPENFSTPLTTTTSSIRAAGARVAERLIGEAAGRKGLPQQEIWKADLIVRASTGPVPTRKRRGTGRHDEAAE